jgi:hypothetical protein
MAKIAARAVALITAVCVTFMFLSPAAALLHTAHPFG